jgi:CBS domain-containing membrane protein
MKRYDVHVGDLMSTALVTIRSNESIQEAHAEMAIGVFRHLPVVDDRGHLVGMLSDRDILSALHGRKPRNVAEVMSRDVITTRVNTPAYSAAQTMLDNKIGSLPVLDSSGALVGIVTQTDFLDVARRALVGLPLER